VGAAHRLPITSTAPRRPARRGRGEPEGRPDPSGAALFNGRSAGLINRLRAFSECFELALPVHFDATLNIEAFIGNVAGHPRTCMQLYLTGAAAPYTHEFQSGSWTLPSMSIETAIPEVPRFATYSGCVLDQLSWQVQRSGLLTATARLMARGETIATTTGAGTPADLAL